MVKDVHQQQKQDEIKEVGLSEDKKKVFGAKERFFLTVSDLKKDYSKEERKLDRLNNFFIFTAVLFGGLLASSVLGQYASAVETLLQNPIPFASAVLATIALILKALEAVWKPGEKLENRRSLLKFVGVLEDLPHRYENQDKLGDEDLIVVLYDILDTIKLQKKS